MRRRPTDEDILRILRAGEAGARVGDVCTAENVPVETYFRWKVKYGDLTPSELKHRRLRERWYRRISVALAAVVVLGVGYAAMIRFSGAPVQPVSANPRRTSTQPPARARTASSPAVAQTAQAAAAAGNAPQASRRNQPVEIGAGATRVGPGDIRAADPDGYAVQVAAVSTLQNARAELERLAGAGYSAYLTRTTAGRLELYRVRVGPFESRRLAEEVAQHLERAGYRTVWITK